MKTVWRSIVNVCDAIVKKSYSSIFSKTPSLGSAKASVLPPNVFASILSPLESYVVSLQSLLIWERPYLSAASFVGLNCLFCLFVLVIHTPGLRFLIFAPMHKWDIFHPFNVRDVIKLVIILLTWEMPLFSASVLIFSNFIFWLAVSWNRRFFSIVACVCLGLFLQRAWVKQIWPEIRVTQPEDDNEGWTPIHPQVLSVPELSQYINDFWRTLQKWWTDIIRLREAYHGLFCLLGCTVFSLLAFVGHLVPGVLIVYSLVLSVSLGPGIALHLIPATIYEQLAGLFFDNADTLTNEKVDSSNYDSELDEFLPVTSLEALRQLSIRRESMETHAGDIVESSRITEEDEDDPHMATIRELGMDSFICESEESSMYTGLGGFPSVEEEGESDLEELLGSNDSPKPQEDNMNFVSSHFKEESSDTDSDAVFTEGLSFAKEAKLPCKEKNQDMPLKSDKAPDTSLPLARTSISSDLDDELMDFEVLEETDIS